LNNSLYLFDTSDKYHVLSIFSFFISDKKSKISLVEYLVYNFIANFFRLIISTIAYKFFVIIKQMIAKAKHEKARRWDINSIRLNLLKVGATIKKRLKE